MHRPHPLQDSGSISPDDPGILVAQLEEHSQEQNNRMNPTHSLQKPIDDFEEDKPGHTQTNKPSKNIRPGRVGEDPTAIAASAAATFFHVIWYDFTRSTGEAISSVDSCLWARGIAP